MTGHEYKNASGMRGCIVLDVESSHTSVWRVCRERVGFDPNGHMDQTSASGLHFLFFLMFSSVLSEYTVLHLRMNAKKRPFSFY